MKTVLRFAAALVCAGMFAGLAPAASPTVLLGGTPAGDVMIAPQAVPTSLTVVAQYDAYLKTITITNTTGAPITCTVQTNQASPIAVLSAVSIAANTSYVIAWPSNGLYYAPLGFSIQANGAGLTYQANWKQ